MLAVEPAGIPASQESEVPGTDRVTTPVEAGTMATKNRIVIFEDKRGWIIAFSSSLRGVSSPLRRYSLGDKHLNGAG